MKQKIYYVSDLHLDVWRDVDWRLPKVENEKDSILIIAGDTCQVNQLPHYMEFYEDVAKRFKATLVIAGNHEFYGGRWETTMDDMHGLLGNVKDLFLLDNSVMQIGDVSFVASTLWTYIGGYDEGYCRSMMNDYHIIYTNGSHRLHPSQTTAKWEENVKFLERNIEPDDKTVVITHHMPSAKSVDLMYLGNRLNTAFVTDISDRIELLKPEFWIHGHTHSSVNVLEYDTNILCNPRGYPTENEELEVKSFEI